MISESNAPLCPAHRRWMASIGCFEEGAKTDAGGGRCFLTSLPGTSGSLFSQAPYHSELPARAAIFVFATLSPAARCLQSTCAVMSVLTPLLLRGLTGPARRLPVPRAQIHSAAAGAARDHGEERAGKGMGDAAGGTEGPAAGWGPAESGALHLAAHSVRGAAGLVWASGERQSAPGSQVRPRQCCPVASLLCKPLAPPAPSA